jgi:hypothetical protein
MVSRADKIIEGFKLGSLGAGKKSVNDMTDEPKKEKTHTIIDSGKVNPPLGTFIGLPYVFWNESDGWSYFFGVNYSKNKGFNLQLSGGPDLDYRTTNDRKKWGIILEGSQWSIEINTGKSGDISFAIAKFNSFNTKIEQNGVSGLRLNSLDFSFLEGKKNFSVWQKNQ